MEIVEDVILGIWEIIVGCGVFLIEVKILEFKIDRFLEIEEGDLGVLEVDIGIVEVKILGILERVLGVQKVLGVGIEVVRVLEVEVVFLEVLEIDVEEVEILQVKE